MRWIPILVALVGCKSVAKDVRLTELSDELALALCEEFHERARRLDCGGPPIELPETDDQLCADRLLDLPLTCPATAKDFRDCMKARQDDDACLPTTDLLEPCAWQIDDSCFRAF